MTIRHRYMHPQQTSGFVFVIVVALTIVSLVTFVFQAGKEKTIWSSQSSAGSVNAQGNAPAGLPNPQTAAQQLSVGGFLQNSPLPHSIQPVRVPGSSHSAIPGTGTIYCPGCGAQGIPVCAGCGCVMQVFPAIPDAYVCPICGHLGTPMCPQCGFHMKTAPQRDLAVGNPNPIPIAAP